jgi:hypothetical protein
MLTYAMRVTGGLLFCIGLFYSLAHAGEGSRPYPPLMPLSRYDDDFSALSQEVKPKDFWDPLKFIPFNSKKDVYLSLGGEARLMYEFFDQANFGAGPQDSGGYFLQRYLLHADLHLGSQVRLFTQLQSSWIEGRSGGARPVDRDELDLHQAFFDWSPYKEEELSFTLRLGRQELNYGSSRIITFREGPNTRFSFDAAKAFWKGNKRSTTRLKMSKRSGDGIPPWILSRFRD